MPAKRHTAAPATPRPRAALWRSLLLVVLSIALALLLCTSIAFGPAPLALDEVPALLWQGWQQWWQGAPAQASDSGMAAAIVFELRAPRALMAASVGAALAVVGLLLQTISHNGLADPYTFGLSSGAAAGAVLVITTVGDIVGIWSLPLAAFSGGLVAAGAVMLLMRGQRLRSPERMVLAGLAVSFLFSALTYLMTFMGDQRAAQSVLFWTMGGFGAARWDNLPIALSGAALAIGFALARHRALDALLAGDAAAHSLGVEPGALRRQVFIATALATACCVAVAGVIGFVGLMAPHLARAVAGALHRRALALCALSGAVLMLLGDVLARRLLAPQELPVGVLIALVGAAFVIGLLARPRP